jgi:putative membrane protein
MNLRRTGLLLAALLVTAALATAAGARTTTASVGPLDEHWLEASAQGDVYEVAVGKLAMQKGSGEACTIGKMLATDHRKSLQDTRKTARQVGVKLPATPDPLQQAIITELSRADGSSFQQMFATIGVGDHRLDIMEAKEEMKDGQTPQVKALAKKELPTLQKHLSAFTKLAKATSSSAIDGTSTTSATDTSAAGCS